MGLPGNVLLSQDPAVQVPSALEVLTVVFGMGTRGTPPPSPPDLKSLCVKVALDKVDAHLRLENWMRNKALVKVETSLSLTVSNL